MDEVSRSDAENSEPIRTARRRKGKKRAVTDEDEYDVPRATKKKTFKSRELVLTDGEDEVQWIGPSERKGKRKAKSSEVLNEPDGWITTWKASKLN